ncbi:AAEL000397-PA [Aedes aegypti]|uniref:AAEL000397-PA n=1 Tax=Aedes aegypti TaxID=7159 RepID=Q0IGF7_AEDAE|nr:AAEL000397-PA [Aedes aegypti]
MHMGLAQPISLSLSSAPSTGSSTAASVLNAANNAAAGGSTGHHQTTSLLVSVPVSNAGAGGNQLNTLNAAGNAGTTAGATGTATVGSAAANILGANSQTTTQTVVLANPQTSVGGSSLLSLPIGKLYGRIQRNGGSNVECHTAAQIVTSGMKGLGQQSIRAATPLTVNTGQPGQQIQLLNISQRPRSGQLPVVSSVTTPITAKQIAARVAAQQRSMSGSTLKIATPITATHHNQQLGQTLNVTTNAAPNQLVMTTKQLHLKLQQQQQQHQQQQAQQIITTANQPAATQIHIQQHQQLAQAQQQLQQQVQVQQQQQQQQQQAQQITINNSVVSSLPLPTITPPPQLTHHQSVVNALASKHRRRSAADLNK